MNRIRRSALVLVLPLLVACGGGGSADGGASDASPSDASPSDASPSDASPSDASPSDASADAASDAGPVSTPLDHVTAIASGHAHACALRDDGTVWCWGDNRSGQLGDGTVTGRPYAAPASIEGVTSIAAGGFSSYAIVDSGQRASWGFDADGQLADNRNVMRVSPSVRGRMDHLQVVGGARHMCTLISGDRLFCAGDNQFGQLGNDSTRDSRVLVRARRVGAEVTRLALGDAHSCVLSEMGVARCWGLNERAELGVGDILNRSLPTLVDTEARFADITAGDIHTCALDMAGALYCWGPNFRKRLGFPDPVLHRSPALVDGAPTMTQISAGGGFTCGLDTVGTVVCWGEDTREQLGVTLDPPERAEILPVPGVERAIQVSAGHDFACALLTDTTVQCWGRDHRGQLGDGQLADTGRPARVLIAE